MQEPVVHLVYPASREENGFFRLVPFPVGLHALGLGVDISKKTFEVAEVVLMNDCRIKVEHGSQKARVEEVQHEGIRLRMG